MSKDFFLESDKKFTIRVPDFVLTVLSTRDNEVVAWAPVNFEH